MSPDDAHALLARLLHGIAPEVDLGTIDPTAALTDEANLDSMGFLDLVTALHEQTGVEIPARDYPLVQTVDGFVSYLTTHPQASPT